MCTEYGIGMWLLGYGSGIVSCFVAYNLFKLLNF
jgi:hypothetical protein